jgi:predicted metal-binding membrane protein
VGLIALASAAWYALAQAEFAMREMQGDGVVIDLMWIMMAPQSVSAYLTVTAAMWVIMMIAMMTPAALPMMLIFSRLERGPRATLDPFLFASGYLASWGAIALLAAVAQWWLHGTGFLHGPTLAAGRVVAGGILIAAGVWQWTPWKEACLSRCRGPLGFFLEHSRAGRAGAFFMGTHHGLYCIGCCWVLMLLMFAGGAMSVLTMAVLASFILFERIVPAGVWVTRMPGLGLIAIGIVLMVH